MLTDPRLGRVRASYDEDQRWLVLRRGGLRVIANLAAGIRRVPLDRPVLSVLAVSGPGVAAGPGSVTMPPSTLAVAGT